MNLKNLFALLPCALALAMPAASAPNRDGLVGVHKTQAATALGDGWLQVTGYSHIINDVRLLEGSTWNHSGSQESPSYFLLADDYISLAYGLGSRWDIGLTIPFFYEEINSGTYTSDGFAWGNAKAQLKFVTPIGDSTSPFTFGILAGASTPSSEAGVGVVPREMEYLPRNEALLKDGSRPYGVGSPEFFGTLAFTYDMSRSPLQVPLLWHLNGGGRKVGFDFGDDRIFDDVGFGSLALEYRHNKWIEVNAEFYHEARLDHFIFRKVQWQKDPTTLTFGAVGNLPAGVTVQAGLVWGILHDKASTVQAQNADADVTHVFGRKATVPASMVFAISWNGQVAKADLDKDGVPNRADKCPIEAEDKDGFEDTDGCPETDNDKDGLADVSDKCPILAEDMDGYEDTDGCPEVDNDKDGIPDVTDKCPLEAQGADGKQGCPNLDKDNDGVANTSDKCPAEAEDKDAFEDDDGCPEADNDKDGVADQLDRCPNAPESINGFQDEDGCPDVAIKKGEKLVLKGVFFKTGSDELLPESFVTLDTLANQLNGQVEVKLEVQGHTDNKGQPSRNKKLSAARAATVVNYLIIKGVAKERLRPFGYGSEKPMGNNKTEAGRALNRRVELLRID